VVQVGDSSPTGVVGLDAGEGLQAIGWAQSSLLLGSVRNAVLHRADCPVIVVRGRLGDGTSGPSPAPGSERES
jgi:Universal stress protein family